MNTGHYVLRYRLTRISQDFSREKRLTFFADGGGARFIEAQDEFEKKRLKVEAEKKEEQAKNAEQVREIIEKNPDNSQPLAPQEYNLLAGGLENPGINGSEKEQIRKLLLSNKPTKVVSILDEVRSGIDPRKLRSDQVAEVVSISPLALKAICSSSSPEDRARRSAYIQILLSLKDAAFAKIRELVQEQVSGGFIEKTKGKEKTLWLELRERADSSYPLEVVREAKQKIQDFVPTRPGPSLAHLESDQEVDQQNSKHHQMLAAIAKLGGKYQSREFQAEARETLESGTQQERSELIELVLAEQDRKFAEQLAHAREKTSEAAVEIAKNISSIFNDFILPATETINDPELRPRVVNIFQYYQEMLAGDLQVVIRTGGDMPNCLAEIGTPETRAINNHLVILEDEVREKRKEYQLLRTTIGEQATKIRNSEHFGQFKERVNSNLIDLEKIQNDFPQVKREHLLDLAKEIVGGNFQVDPQYLKMNAELADQFGLNPVEAARLIRGDEPLAVMDVAGTTGAGFRRKAFEKSDLDSVESERNFGQSDSLKYLLGRNRSGVDLLEDLIRRFLEVREMASRLYASPDQAELIQIIDQNLTNLQKMQVLIPDLQQRLSQMEQGANKLQATLEARSDLQPQEIAQGKAAIAQKQRQIDNLKTNAAKVMVEMSELNPDPNALLAGGPEANAWYADSSAIFNKGLGALESMQERMIEQSRHERPLMQILETGKAQEIEAATTPPKPVDLRGVSRVIPLNRFNEKYGGETQEQKLPPEAEKYGQIKDVMLEIITKRRVTPEILKFLRDDLGIVEVLTDDQWSQRFGNDRAKMERQYRNQYKIYLKASQLFNPANLLHELAHVTDELTGGKAREQLRGRFEPGFWDQKRREFEQLKSDPQGALANNADFTEEMYARLIAQDFAGAAGPLARELNDYLKNNGVNLADPEILKQFLPDKESIRQGFWSNFVAKKAAAEGDSGSDEKLEPPITDPERLQKLWGKFDNKVKDIRAKLEAISKSDADGKAEFISGAEGYIQEIRSTLDANPTESGFTAAFENDSKAEPPGLKGVEEVCNSSLDDVVKSETDSSGYFKEIWDNTTFLTLHDIFTTGKTVLVDHFKRQIERSSKRRTGVAGSSIFTGRLAAEYDLQAESAESEEVSKVQESLKNKDPWQVYDRLDSTSNADVVKACLNQLAETGMLDWRNKVVWKAFNRLNCGVRFREEDTVDYGLIRKKMLKACTIIWDCDYFSSTDRKNNSSYDSHKKEYENEANLTANIAGELKSMLYDKKTKGERARVDPMRYEMFIDFCIPAGKMTPEHVIYYIIQGVAKGIMTPERAISLDNSYLNNVPVINYFSSYNPSLAEYKKWGKMFDTEDCAMHPGFTRWLNANFMTSQRVVERTIKASAQPDKWDHDYANYIASIGDMTSAKSYLGLNHDGSPKYPSTSYWNAVDGQIQHLTDIANFSYELSDKDKISWLSRQAGYLATFDGIAYNRLDKENNRLFRLTASDKNTMSRSKGYSKLKTREASQRIRDILTAIEPDYFKTLFEIKEPKGGDARKVKKLIGEFEQGGKYHSYLYDKDGNKDIDEPKDLKGLYDIIPAFVERHCERNLGDPKADPLRRTFEKAREIYRKDHGDQPPKKDDNWNWKTNEVSPYYADAV